jgi:hypothetical protein
LYGDVDTSQMLAGVIDRLVHHTRASAPPFVLETTAAAVQVPASAPLVLCLHEVRFHQSQQTDQFFFDALRDRGFTVTALPLPDLGEPFCLAVEERYFKLNAVYRHR